MIKLIKGQKCSPLKGSIWQRWHEIFVPIICGCYISSNVSAQCKVTCSQKSISLRDPWNESKFNLKIKECMVVATLGIEEWRKQLVLHWWLDPYCKDNVQVVFLQDANTDPQEKILIDKIKVCWVTTYVSFSLTALSPTAGE